MAARDLQAHHWRPISRLQRDEEANGNAEDDNFPAVVLKSLLVRRWWAIILIAGISGGIAYFASEEFSSTTSEIETTLIHGGLPSLPGAQAYQGLSTNTCASLLTSPSLLNQLREQRGIEMPPMTLAKQLSVRAPHATDLIEVQLTWSDPVEGIVILNQLTEIFIEKIAEMRRERLREHIKHIEIASLEAGSEVDAARQRIDRLRREQGEMLASEGQSGDQYRSLLSNIANTQLAIDEKRLQELGIRQQMDAVAAKLVTVQSKYVETIEEIKAETLEALLPVLQEAKEQYAEDSSPNRRMGELVQRIGSEVNQFKEQAFDVQQAKFEETIEPSSADLSQWRRELSLTLARNMEFLSESDREEAAFVLSETIDARTSQVKALVEEMRTLQQKREEYELALIPVGNQLKMLETRSKDYEKQARGLGTTITGLGVTQLDEAGESLEKAVARQESLALQLDNMKQLEQWRVREWAVNVPASPETTTVDSNRKKIAVLLFGMCGLLLGLPVLLLERQHCQELPQIRTARSMGLPILAERVLKNFLPNRREPWVLDTTTKSDVVESLRMLALRIQQSAHRKGSVILFTSMDSSPSSIPLTAAVAQCLADREEKVLIIDAVSPGDTKTFENILAPVLTTGQALLTSTQEPTKEMESAANEAKVEAEPQTGLSEFLQNTELVPENVIRRTRMANVDVLTSGLQPFHREAMATSKLTRLLEHCRESYSIILMRGPCACKAADTQMLTARADGVIVLAGSKAHQDKEAQACVKDLVELGAPIVGVVA